MPVRMGLPSLNELQARTVQSGECWIWQGAFAGDYPCIRRGGVLYKVHRLTWELTYGMSLGDSDALHKCSNKACINPKHVFPGNHSINGNQYHDEQFRTGSVSPHGNGFRAKVVVRGTVHRKWFSTKELAEAWLDNVVLETQNAQRA